MANNNLNFKLRDRDSILTQEGLLFRVFGYNHPPNTYLCDAEYASSKIFQSTDPRAPREGRNMLFYKFYNDEGMKLVAKKYPQYLVFHEMLGVELVGVKDKDIMEVHEPQKRLAELLKQGPTDELLAAMERTLKIATTSSGLQTSDFGVFGSMLHGFHHPKYSDIDFTIYGKQQNAKMRQTLAKLYDAPASGLTNEFASDHVMDGKRWLFTNFEVKDFIWHQRRKQIYGLYDDRKNSGRVIKAEFEPVKAWDEIVNEYDPKLCITRRGWAKIKARVTVDDDGPFIPSVYGIEPIEVLSGPSGSEEVVRVFSYMEEFRQQVHKDETIIVEGNLEEVQSPEPGKSFHQITLTYCPRYYDQVLKALH
ncbi:MAG: nucleotidyltransferase domain-containing protein [Candidatus Bathyarchaeia archaeon]